VAEGAQPAALVKVRPQQLGESKDILPVRNRKKEHQMNDNNPGVDVNILDKANEAQDVYITNPNMKTANAYTQALPETTMTLIDSILMLAGPEFRKLTREELERDPGEKANRGMTPTRFPTAYWRQVINRP
jgi:hypothetical protein